jgi:hypothetical protein
MPGAKCPSYYGASIAFKNFSIDTSGRKQFKQRQGDILGCLTTYKERQRSQVFLTFRIRYWVWYDDWAGNHKNSKQLIDNFLSIIHFSI